MSKSFDPTDLKLMKAIGKAPPVEMSQWNKSQRFYILHHQKPIHDGGTVYNVDNLVIVTPRYHQEILNSKYHYGKYKNDQTRIN